MPGAVLAVKLIDVVVVIESIILNPTVFACAWEQDTQKRKLLYDIVLNMDRYEYIFFFL